MNIAHGETRTLDLGAITLARDWGWAPEYVEAMRRMLDRDTPEDFAIATGETHALEEFVEATFDRLQLDWRDHVVTSDVYLRPADIQYSSGDASKTERLLGWKHRRKCMT